MKQQVLNVAGLLAGLVVGFVLTPQPLLARFAPAHVTWDGSQCEAGRYTITSTASNLSTGESFQTTSIDVRLPLTSVGQDFSELPPGTYLITARLVNSDGAVFQSNTQTITIGVSPKLSASTLPTDGRHRPDSSPVEGTAQPRSPSSTAGGQSSGGGTTGGPVMSRSASASTGGTRTAKTRQLVAAQVQMAVSVAWVLETLDQLRTVAHGGASVVRDIAVIDADGDGTTVYVRAVVGGRVMIWRIAQ